MTTHEANPRKAEMRQLVKTGQDTGKIIKGKPGSVNEFLIACYKAETGQEDFRTFKSWKDAGMMVKKGERGFPIFSRPVSVIKAEKGKEANEEEAGLFGTCYLFHSGQVEHINNAKQ